MKEINQVFVKSPYIFELRKKQIGKLKEDEVLVKIKACGICGADVLCADNAAGDFVPVGHEFSGIVEEIGSNAVNYKPGDKVTVENHTMCGVCKNCKNGQPEYCKNARKYFGIEAGLADYIVVHNSLLNHFDNMSFEEAAIVEPLTVALDLVIGCDVKLNNTVAVFGTGTIGMLAIQAAKLSGAKSVISVGSGSNKKRSEFKETISKKMGADFYININDLDFVKSIEKNFSEGVDRILITSPPQTFLNAIKIAAFGAIIGIIGWVESEEKNVTFDMNEFHFKRLQLRGIHPVPNLMFPLATDLIKSNKITVKDLITHRFKFAEFEKAFDLFKDPAQKVLKVMITD